MRAAVVDRTGPPSVLAVREVPPPQPAGREVRIAVAACGVCFHDVVVRNGTFRRGVGLPVILGHEVAGIVDAVGSEVSCLKVDDRVATTTHSHVCGMCRRCRGGLETTCPERVFLGDAGLNGGYAEFVCVDEDNAVRVPDGIPLHEAAVTACTIGTELNAIREIGRVQAGERVLVTGAGGGLGIHGVQLAKLSGATVLAVTTTDSKARRIREAGADEVIVVPPGTDFSGAVREATYGDGVDAVIDNVGSPVFASVRKSVADDGRIVLVGQVTGDFVSVNLAQLFLRNVSIRSAKGVSRAQLEDSLRLVLAGRILPVVSVRMPLARAAEAHEAVETARSFGRIVLEPAA